MSLKSTVRVASVQMISTPRLQDNLDRAAQLLAEAAQAGAQMAVLPEYFCLMGHKDTDKLAITENEGVGPIQEFLSAQARDLGISIVGGTLPLRSPSEGKVFNTSLVFDAQGQPIARYDKIHLFCFQGVNESYDEGRVLVAGQTPVAMDVPLYKAVEGAPNNAQPNGGLNKLRLGLSICYDLRFPELYRAMGPVDLIVVPAAFTYTTGLAHWELLLRARAVENQCYVLGCGQGGVHENGRRTFGHSMVIDPWGEVLEVLPEGEGVVIADLSPDKMNDIRSRLPALNHRVL
ncbi:MAG: carbon-nitrogen hydrolase family protein [Limnobacter sp.]|nr:carbon-nitrogen hydrolase family protein [Limnobacter sp.]